MTNEEYLEVRIGILENALSQLIQSELSTLQPYQSQRWEILDSINQRCLSDLSFVDSQRNMAVSN